MIKILLGEDLELFLISTQITAGVPQESSLGAFLFIYMFTLGKVFHEHNISFHCYANIKQIYLAFNHQPAQVPSLAVSSECRQIRQKLKT